MKEKFLDIYTQIITREGSDRLLSWLESTDFFTAPASTRYHLSREGGLCEHSLNVWDRLSRALSDDPTLSLETLAVCGLLHDVCKANFYKTEMRNAKDESGKWIKVPYYAVDDQLPFGHGEKSVYIISGFMKLTREEAMAIRWHMGGFDESAKGGSSALSKAFSDYTLALHLHIADMQATYLDERE